MAKNTIISNLDKLIGFFSPSLMLKRAKSKAAINAISENARKFEGATLGRRGRSMPFGMESNPNTSITGQLNRLIARSIDLYDNNSYAKKGIKTIVFSVIGTGIQLATKGGTKRQNDAVKKSFNDWALSKKCDFLGRKNFLSLQKQVMMVVAIEGSCLVIRRKTKAKGSDIPLQIQVISSTRLATDYNTIGTEASNENFITNGIEFDSQGKRVAYHIYKSVPQNVNDLQLDYLRISAEDCLHIYEEDILGRVTGVPFLATAMLRMSDADGYEDAQLMRQKIAACFSVFVSGPPSSAFGSEQENDMLDRVEPGIIERVSPGDSVTFASPPQAEGYGEYMSKIHQGIASGIGITYEQMTGDLSGVNFSSGRMGWIEAQKQVEDWQYNLMIPDFCTPIFEWFKESAALIGIKADNVMPEWTPRGRFMIDPAKEIKAKIAELGAGVKSWSEVVREMGYNPDDLIEEMREEREKLANFNLEWMPSNENS